MNYIGGYKIVDFTEEPEVVYAKLDDNLKNGGKPVIVKNVVFDIPDGEGGYIEFTVPPTFVSMAKNIEDDSQFNGYVVNGDQLIKISVSEDSNSANIAIWSINDTAAMFAPTEFGGTMPTDDGTYVLTCTVTGGAGTITWESAGE